MMAGEQLGVGHEPRHGTAYVGSWIKALQDDPKEIRLASIDAQKAADWMVERTRTIEREHPIAPDQGGENSDPMRHANHNPAAVPLQPDPERAATAARETEREAARETETLSPSR